MDAVISMWKRTDTRPVTIGNVQVGGQERIVLQTMLERPAKDIDENLSAIARLQKEGAELIRVAVTDTADADAFRMLKEHTEVPLIADIHFDHRLALQAMDAGADKIRINPGNIAKREHLEAIVRTAKEKNISIRIGINAGSLEKQIEKAFGRTPKAMVESAKHHVAFFKSLDFHDIVLSFKASSVPLTIDANLLAAKTFPYPLHIGITEAGTLKGGTVTSSLGLGAIIHQGIGDTMRVSLAADRKEELRLGKRILAAFGLAKEGRLIVCPGCGRLEYDMRPLVEKVENYLENNPTDLTVAIMGCGVNGPGEAKEADIGIAGGKGEGLLFTKGKVVEKIPEDRLFEALVEAIESQKNSAM